MEYSIDRMREDDWAQVAAIYLSGVQTGEAAFRSEVPSWEVWDRTYAGTCRLVARSGSEVLGWAALIPVSNLCVLAGVAEVSIYLAPSRRGQGIGTALLRRLISLSEEDGYWTLQSEIMRENEASIHLHEACGFRRVGVRERLGRTCDGTWHDVVLMELRSGIVGM